MPPAGIPTLDLIGSIYDAVADARRWPAFLESFVHAVGGARGSLALLDPGMRAPDIVCWYGWPEDELRDYAERYAATDPFTAPSAELQEGEVATSNEICTPAQLEQSLTYREFYCRCSAAHGIGGAILRTSKTTSAIFAQRGKERGPFGSAEKDIIRPLLPHLKRAAMLHGELTSLRSQLATFTAHLEQYPHALLLSDSDGRVLYANAAARNIAAREDGLRIASGRLAVSPADEDRLFRALRDVTNRHAVEFSRVTIKRRSHNRPYHFIIVPVPQTAAMPFGMVQPTVAVFIVDSDSALQPDTAMLQGLFNLTPAEARVSGLLAAGRNVDEIAADLQVTVDTVRTHVRRVLSKTATDRQGELISLVLRTVPFPVHLTEKNG